MRQRRSLPRSLVFERDGLDPATEECVLLFEPIERGVQRHDNRVRLISDDDQFESDFLYSI
jgi:hypothetical protein